jgi:hypothetical protein
MNNTEIYGGTHLTNMDHNTTFSVVDGLCLQVMNKGHIVYMDGWFSSPKLFDHPWTYKKMSVGTVMPNKKVLPKHTFSKELKVQEAFACQRQYPLGYKMERHQKHSHFSTAHTNVMAVHWHAGDSTNKQNLQQLWIT